ncbi:hypothetical protein L914_10736, partial [Phytophthora nicotianae]
MAKMQTEVNQRNLHGIDKCDNQLVLNVWCLPLQYKASCCHDEKPNVRFSTTITTTRD